MRYCSFQTLKFMAKFKLKLLPVSCYNLLDLPNPSKLHNTRSVIQFNYCHYSNNVSKRCLHHRGPPLWDSLPLLTRNAADIHSFTRDVFGFLVDSYKEKTNYCGYYGLLRIYCSTLYCGVCLTQCLFDF